MASSTTKSLIGWLAIMLFAPPIVGFLLATQQPGLGIIFYLVLMIGLGIRAAAVLTATPWKRALIGVLLAVGLLLVQGTVIFAGCMMILGGPHFD